jgi:cell wall-associated NlpC family hydrolase
MGSKLISFEKIEEVARSLIGIPYQHNGRNEDGIDCWGLVYLFFKEVGIELPLDDGGEPAPDDWYKVSPDRYLNGLKTLGEEVGHYRNLQPLDLPYFKLYRNVVTHSGVMLDDEHFIHVLNDKEVNVATMKRKIWYKKYAGAIRLPRLEDYQFNIT